MKVNNLLLYITFLTSFTIATLKEIQMDAVYTWVNGSDPVWLEQYEKYVG